MKLHATPAEEYCQALVTPEYFEVTGLDVQSCSRTRLYLSDASSAVSELVSNVAAMGQDLTQPELFVAIGIPVFLIFPLVYSWIKNINDKMKSAREIEEAREARVSGDRSTAPERNNTDERPFFAADKVIGVVIALSIFGYLAFSLCMFLFIIFFPLFAVLVEVHRVVNLVSIISFLIQQYLNLVVFFLNKVPIPAQAFSITACRFWYFDHLPSEQMLLGQERPRAEQAENSVNSQNAYEERAFRPEEQDSGASIFSDQPRQSNLDLTELNQKNHELAEQLKQMKGLLTAATKKSASDNKIVIELKQKNDDLLAQLEKSGKELIEKKKIESITTPCRETALKLHEVYGAAKKQKAVNKQIEQTKRNRKKGELMTAATEKSAADESKRCVYIKDWDGKTRVLHAKSHDTIKDLKIEFWRKTQIWVDCNVLYYGGKLLKDDKTLEYYQIGKLSTLQSSGCLRQRHFTSLPSNNQKGVKRDSEIVINSARQPLNHPSVVVSYSRLVAVASEDGRPLKRVQIPGCLVLEENPMYVAKTLKFKPDEPLPAGQEIFVSVYGNGAGEDSKVHEFSFTTQECELTAARKNITELNQKNDYLRAQFEKRGKELIEKTKKETKALQTCSFLERELASCYRKMEDEAERSQKQQRQLSQATAEHDRCERCEVCMDKDRTVVFLPCTHFACCSTCADLVTDCPICRTPISRRLGITKT